MLCVPAPWYGSVTPDQWERRANASLNKRLECVGLGFEKHLVVLQVSELLMHPFSGSAGI